MSEIYGLAFAGEIRYVGKTTATGASRLREHLANARRGHRRQRRLWAWLRSLPGAPEVVVLERDPVGGLDAAERMWIATLLGFGCRLTNMTPGGEGQPKGYVPSQETRERVSKTLRGRGRRSDEWCRNLSVALKGHKVSKETGRKISEAKKGQPAANKRVWTPELRELALDAYSRMSSREAANELGVGVHQLRAFLRSEGVLRKNTESANPSRKQHSDEAKARMAEIKRQHHARGDYERAPR